MLHIYSLIYSTEQPDHPGAWKRGEERQPPGTSGHNGGLAALQASALVPGSHQPHLGNQGGHWMRPEDGRVLDLLSCWEAKRGLEICPVCLKGTLF